VTLSRLYCLEMTTELESAKEQFAHHVLRALSALYDPTVLSSSILAGLLGIEQENDPVVTLRQILIGAIESLKPDEPIPPGSRSWRVYQVLRRRYTEQLTQHEVAANLGLSIRQLQREEKIAREVIAERLWTTHNIGAKMHLINAVRQWGIDVQLDVSVAPSAVQELESLSRSTPVQIIQLGEVIQEVLDTLQPILSTSHTTAVYRESMNLPPVTVKLPMLRQALVNIISVAARFAAGERLNVRTNHEGSHVYISLQAMHHPGAIVEETSNYLETLEMAKQLLDFCHAELRYTVYSETEMEQSIPGNSDAFVAVAEFQIAEVFSVLVIDDNDDARQLLQRYLYGTPYQFVGAEDGQQALDIVQQIIPKAIVLDVMMPKQDGWALIAILRNLPRLQRVPIIVSTILPQKDLAYALGAAEFIRKPVKRLDLLAALTRQLGPQIGLT
jgi:CheY-like chemotaxis protein